MLKGTAHRLHTRGSINVDLSSQFKRCSAAEIADFIHHGVDDAVLEDMFHQVSFRSARLERFMEETYDADDWHYFEIDRESFIQWAAEHKPTSLKDLDPEERAMFNVDEIITAAKALRRAKRTSSS